MLCLGFHRDDEAYGITPPISVAKPTEADLRQSKELEETLRQYGMFESPEESEKRYVPRCVVGQGQGQRFHIFWAFSWRNVESVYFVAR